MPKGVLILRQFADVPQGGAGLNIGLLEEVSMPREYEDILNCKSTTTAIHESFLLGVEESESDDADFGGGGGGDSVVLSSGSSDIDEHQPQSSSWRRWDYTTAWQLEIPHCCSETPKSWEEKEGGAAGSGDEDDHIDSVLRGNRVANSCSNPDVFAEPTPTARGESIIGEASGRQRNNTELIDEGDAKEDRKRFSTTTSEERNRGKNQMYVTNRRKHPTTGLCQRTTPTSTTPNPYLTDRRGRAATRMTNYGELWHSSSRARSLPSSLNKWSPDQEWTLRQKDVSVREMKQRYELGVPDSLPTHQQQRPRSPTTADGLRQGSVHSYLHNRASSNPKSPATLPYRSRSFHNSPIAESDNGIIDSEFSPPTPSYRFKLKGGEQQIVPTETTNSHPLRRSSLEKLISSRKGGGLSLSNKTAAQSKSMPSLGSIDGDDGMFALRNGKYVKIDGDSQAASNKPPHRSLQPHRINQGTLSSVMSDGGTKTADKNQCLDSTFSAASQQATDSKLHATHNIEKRIQELKTSSKVNENDTQPTEAAPEWVNRVREMENRRNRKHDQRMNEYERGQRSLSHDSPGRINSRSQPSLSHEAERKSGSSSPLTPLWVDVNSSRSAGCQQERIPGYGRVDAAPIAKNFEKTKSYFEDISRWRLEEIEQTNNNSEQPNRMSSAGQATPDKALDTDDWHAHPELEIRLNHPRVEKVQRGSTRKERVNDDHQRGRSAEGGLYFMLHERNSNSSPPLRYEEGLFNYDLPQTEEKSHAISSLSNNVPSRPKQSSHSTSSNSKVGPLRCYWDSQTHSWIKVHFPDEDAVGPRQLCWRSQSTSLLSGSTSVSSRAGDCPSPLVAELRPLFADMRRRPEPRPYNMFSASIDRESTPRGGMSGNSAVSLTHSYHQHPHMPDGTGTVAVKKKTTLHAAINMNSPTVVSRTAGNRNQRYWEYSP